MHRNNLRRYSLNTRPNTTQSPGADQADNELRPPVALREISDRARSGVGKSRYHPFRPRTGSYWEEKEADFRPRLHGGTQGGLHIFREEMAA